jgi:hypothetical protein
VHRIAPPQDIGLAAEDAGAGANVARVPFGPGFEKAWNVLDRVMEKGSPLQGYRAARSSTI